MNEGENLFNLIQQSKGGDSESLMYILERFNPLIIKYTQKLNYDDAKNELTEKMLLLICHMPEIDNDGKIVSYIHTSIVHEYQKLSQQKKKLQSMNCFDECMFEDISTQQDYSDINFFNLLIPLNTRQQQIIKYKYYNGYTTNEIAKKLQISRQSVYRNEKFALNLLKTLI